MKTDLYIVSVVGIKLFPSRMHIEKEFGEVLYHQLISVLNVLGQEIKEPQHAHLRLGVYLDSNNNAGTRYFSLSKKHFIVIADHFGHKFHSHLEEYSKREQRKGSNILFQLNNGNISMQDFADHLSDSNNNH